MDKKLLSKKEVAQMIGVGLVSLWRWERAGDFPARVQLSARRVGYHEADIRNWIETRQTVGGTK